VLGLTAATTAALFWAVATVFYRRIGRVMPPVRLNLFKGTLAAALLAALVGWQWLRGGDNPLALRPGLMALLAASGVIGLAGGDTCFFAALNRLGARRALLMLMLAPVLTAALAWPLLGERLNPSQWLGILATCGGIAWVIGERKGGSSDGRVDALGLLLALGAAICQALGSLMSRHVFDQADYGSAPSALIRLAAASVVLCFMLPIDRLLRDPGGSDADHPARPGPMKIWLMLAAATLLGTFFGIWFQQVAIKLSTNLGVAATLLSTSPLFVLPIAAATGERISPRAIAGAVIGLLGVAVLFGVFA